MKLARFGQAGNENSFGGVDEHGRETCESGTCLPGFEEVHSPAGADDSIGNSCKPCREGSQSSDGSPCSCACLVLRQQPAAQCANVARQAVSQPRLGTASAVFVRLGRLPQRTATHVPLALLARFQLQVLSIAPGALLVLWQMTGVV